VPRGPEGGDQSLIRAVARFRTTARSDLRHGEAWTAPSRAAAGCEPRSVARNGDTVDGWNSLRRASKRPASARLGSSARDQEIRPALRAWSRMGLAPSSKASTAFVAPASAHRPAGGSTYSPRPQFLFPRQSHRADADRLESGT
jgi:hypothetical protein